MKLRSIGMAMALAAVSQPAMAAPNGSIIKCHWETPYVGDDEPTYKIYKTHWEVFNDEAWTWAPIPCQNLADHPANCTASSSETLHNWAYKSAHTGSGGNVIDNYSMQINRASGRASWTRYYSAIFTHHPNFNKVTQTSGAGQCEPAYDPALKPKPRPAAPRM